MKLDQDKAKMLLGEDFAVLREWLLDRQGYWMKVGFRENDAFTRGVYVGKHDMIDEIFRKLQDWAKEIDDNTN